MRQGGFYQITFFEVGRLSSDFLLDEGGRLFWDTLQVGTEGTKELIPYRCRCSVKKASHFLLPAGMSLSKISLAENSLIIPGQKNC